MTSLKKICLHWTAGSNKPCNEDLNAYHYCIDKDGKIFAGKYKPEDNLNCKDGVYARHCGGGNTGCIGLSVCGMANFSLSKKETKYPLTKEQVEALCCLTAYLSINYGFLINPSTVFTHYEFDRKRVKPEGKIDITYLSFLPNLPISRVAGYLRNKANWYRIKIKQGKYKFIKKGDYYEFLVKN